MIIGMGIDLVDLKRIKEITDERFLKRVLSDKELKLYQNIAAENTKLSFIGGRFAAKEALFKAISKGHGKTNYIDFSILNEDNGKPYVETEYFKHQAVIHISITHTDEHAMAYVIIEKI